jgi:hypothetical protein
MIIGRSAITGQELFFQNSVGVKNGLGESRLKSVFFLKPGAVFSKPDLLKKSRMLFFVVMSIIGLGSCTRNSKDIALVPPPTPPLSRSFLGYGVISVSYTQVLKEPVQGSESLGYLRRSSLVRILERKKVNHRGAFESWVLVEGNYRGWLREDMVQIYNNEARAKTAAESIYR